MKDPEKSHAQSREMYTKDPEKSRADTAAQSRKIIITRRTWRRVMSPPIPNYVLRSLQLSKTDF